MARTAVLGLPRIGPDRELKFALESYWASDIGASDLLETARGLRAANWQRAHAAGIDVIPSGDFSLYDHVLDAAWALGAIPDRFGDLDRDDLEAYFALARGTDDQRPLEMTKWFDTNYHYLVPELHRGQRFEPRAEHWTEPLREAAALGIQTRPVVLGPLSFLLLSKGLERPLDALDDLVPVYTELLRALADAGATEAQIDEPCLTLDRTGSELDAFADAWGALSGGSDLELCLATYFAGLDVGGALERVLELPVAEVHLDLVRAPGQLDKALAALGDRTTRLSLGVLDGRNVWATDLDAALEPIDAARAAIGSDRVTIAPSCSLLHVPYEAARETGIDPEVRGWLAFGAEKLAELALLADAADAPTERRDTLLADARETIGARRTSAHTNDPAVRERVGSLDLSDYDRDASATARREAQRARVDLPDLPTTTIGSYPQTAEIRGARKDLREGRMDEAAYERFLEGQIAHVIEVQEGLGLDVLVHGEPERNDMVEYFGQQLAGFAFSGSGWVQSYGSRCVKPPILYGDVARPSPMTVRWWRHAQSLSEKPVKGMLTGPVTILQWSFVRDDQPERETCTQIALAIQDEVLDLERAGAFAIQVDEAALREGLPLQRSAQDEWVRWAVDCFRLTVAPAREDTQIHTHMCYSEFNDIMEHIVRLDADVISIEASRSDMEVLDAFAGELDYPNDIGPGVYDIHSPRVPSVEEIEDLLERAEARIGRERLWVNPDCGLKTRRWDEVLPALEHMLAATRRRRAAGPVRA
ncbi:MAG TPA: 5-methyltetrahydropteroyltriglutamate--homocysteine S-methyltransferase [Solirubrobacteraceae bacterium]|nr:5-methyltetrahydropteroyltriglutamate--homocysteine S-methyltransferase [Solirubrobacteraceae bacterium]